MRSLFAVLRRLVIPAGAFNVPRIEFTSDIPADLQAYYQALVPNPLTVVAAFLFWQDATQYAYLALTVDVGGGAGMVIGRSNTNNGVHELCIFNVSNTALVSWVFGRAALGAVQPQVSFGTTATLTVQGTFNGSGTNNLSGTVAIAAGTAFTVDSVSMTRGHFAGTQRTDNGTVVTTAGVAETAVPSANWDSEPTYVFRNGGMFMAIVNCRSYESTGAGGVVGLIRLRKGTATVVGTQLWAKQKHYPVGFAGQVDSDTYVMYFKNTSGSDVSTKLSLTIAGQLGGGNWSLYGDANDKLSIDIVDIGDTSDHASLAAMSISV